MTRSGRYSGAGNSEAKGLTDITTDQKLVRLLKDDGTWTEFEADWKRQCEQLGEDFDSYAGSTFSVISDLVEKEQKKAGVFGLKIGNSYSAMCQVNKAGLPKYDSPVLRTRYMTLSKRAACGYISHGSNATLIAYVHWVGRPMKGSEDMTDKLKAAFREAIVDAINEIGVEQFKKTSLFMSNNRAEEIHKLAA